MYVDEYGRVGIGLDNPGEIIQIVAEDPMIKITDDGDLNWGIQALGAGDTRRFSIGDDTTATLDGNILTILYGGNIGIGTTSPYADLSVSGNMAVTGTTMFNNQTYTWPGSQSGNYFLKTDGSGQLSWAQASGGIYYGEPGSLAFYKDAGIMATGTTGNLLYWDDTNARLGIGTTSPWGHLSVEGQGTYPELVVTGADMVPDLVIDANGRLGLGTANPGYLFDLTGSTTDYLARLYNTNTGTSSSGLYIRSDGTSGSLLTLNFGGSDIVNITGAQSTFNNPVLFGAAGDVSMAKNLNFSNDISAYINFQGPGYIRTDSASENLDLTLSAANLGESHSRRRPDRNRHDYDRFDRDLTERGRQRLRPGNGR